MSNSQSSHNSMPSDVFSGEEGRIGIWTNQDLCLSRLSEKHLGRLWLQLSFHKQTNKQKIYFRSNQKRVDVIKLENHLRLKDCCRCYKTLKTRNENAKFWSAFPYKWKPLNVIPLGQVIVDHINQMIAITDDFYIVKALVNWTCKGWQAK